MRSQEIIIVKRNLFYILTNRNKAVTITVFSFLSGEEVPPVPRKEHNNVTAQMTLPGMVRRERRKAWHILTGES